MAAPGSHSTRGIIWRTSALPRDGEFATIRAGYPNASEVVNYWARLRDWWMLIRAVGSTYEVLVVNGEHGSEFNDEIDDLDSAKRIAVHIAKSFMVDLSDKDTTPVPDVTHVEEAMPHVMWRYGQPPFDRDGPSEDKGGVWWARIGDMYAVVYDACQRVGTAYALEVYELDGEEFIKYVEKNISLEDAKKQAARMAADPFNDGEDDGIEPPMVESLLSEMVGFRWRPASTVPQKTEAMMVEAGLEPLSLVEWAMYGHYHALIMNGSLWSEQETTDPRYMVVILNSTRNVAFTPYNYCEDIKRLETARRTGLDLLKRTIKVNKEDDGIEPPITESHVIWRKTRMPDFPNSHLRPIIEYDEWARIGKYFAVVGKAQNSAALQIRLYGRVLPYAAHVYDKYGGNLGTLRSTSLEDAKSKACAKCRDLIYGPNGRLTSKDGVEPPMTEARTRPVWVTTQVTTAQVDETVYRARYGGRNLTVYRIRKRKRYGDNDVRLVDCDEVWRWTTSDKYRFIDGHEGSREAAQLSAQNAKPNQIRWKYDPQNPCHKVMGAVEVDQEPPPPIVESHLNWKKTMGGNWVSIVGNATVTVWTITNANTEPRWWWRIEEGHRSNRPMPLTSTDLNVQYYATSDQAKEAVEKILPRYKKVAAKLNRNNNFEDEEPEPPITEATSRLATWRKESEYHSLHTAPGINGCQLRVYLSCQQWYWTIAKNGMILKGPVKALSFEDAKNKAAKCKSWVAKYRNLFPSNEEPEPPITEASMPWRKGSPPVSGYRKKSGDQWVHYKGLTLVINNEEHKDIAPESVLLVFKHCRLVDYLRCGTPDDAKIRAQRFANDILTYQNQEDDVEPPT